MRGVMILIRRRPIIEGRDASPFASVDTGQPLIFDGRDATCVPVMAKPGTETSPDIDVEEKLKEAFSRGWSVIVWNDPVNLMDYVVYVFKSVLKMNEQDASRHMWEVHQNGKSVVARETREKSELIVHRLRGFGLNATLEPV
jgi:ATP-dependent Clp protease adaptor protein ClpS